MQAGLATSGGGSRPGSMRGCDGMSSVGAGAGPGAGLAGMLPLSAVGALPTSGGIPLSAVGSLPLGLQGVPQQSMQDSGSFTFPSRLSQEAPASHYGSQVGHMPLPQQQLQQQQFTDQNALYQQQQLELLLAAQQRHEEEVILQSLHASDYARPIRSPLTWSAWYHELYPLRCVCASCYR